MSARSFWSTFAAGGWSVDLLRVVRWLLGGGVVTLGWNWFVAPLGAAHVSMLEGLALTVLASALLLSPVEESRVLPPAPPPRETFAEAIEEVIEEHDTQAEQRVYTMAAREGKLIMGYLFLLGWLVVLHIAQIVGS